MKNVSGKKFAKIVEHHGWRLLRIQGSHHVYGKPDSGSSANSVVRLSIPIHGNNPLKAGLLKHMMKLAGITDADF